MLGCKYTLQKVDELKVSWDDITCKLTSKIYHQKSYHSNIKYHRTLTTNLV